MAAAVGQGFFGGFLRLAGEAVLLGAFGKLLFQQVLPPLGTQLHDKPGNQGAEQGGTRGDNGQGGKVHNTGRLKTLDGRLYHVSDGRFTAAKTADCGGTGVQTAERAVPPRGLWKTGKVVYLYLFVFKWLF
jgi:hypothetical protein